MLLNSKVTSPYSDISFDEEIRLVGKNLQYTVLSIGYIYVEYVMVLIRLSYRS